MRHLGSVVLGVWLIAHGLIGLIGLSFQGMSVVMGVLAVVAGVLIMLRR